MELSGVFLNVGRTKETYPQVSRAHLLGSAVLAG